MEIVRSVIDFFNHPFFIIVGGLATLLSVVGFLYIIYLVVKGIMPVWYRLGIGLSRKKIAIFAAEEFDNLRSMLVDSNIFAEKNIVKIDKQSIKKAQSISLLLVHWKAFEADIDNILGIKNDSDALIIYAPKNEGLIDDKNLEKIDRERNSIIVNFRGRLLNDILTSMITTGYEKR